MKQSRRGTSVGGLAVVCRTQSVGAEAGAQNQAKLVSWAEIASQGANQLAMGSGVQCGSLSQSWWSYKWSVRGRGANLMEVCGPFS